MPGSIESCAFKQQSGVLVRYDEYDIAPSDQILGLLSGAGMTSLRDAVADAVLVERALESFGLVGPDLGPAPCAAQGCTLVKPSIDRMSFANHCATPERYWGRGSVGRRGWCRTCP